MIERQIPSTGEKIPVLGMGTWQTFDRSASSDLSQLQKVVDVFSGGGGRLIDSSPMYGRSEEVVGKLTGDAPQDKFFWATKVWTSGREEGIRQMQHSFQMFRRDVIDLMQIHNLVDWKIHLRTLRQWKDEGKIRYIGITHYTDSMHGELLSVLREEPMDFVQFNYSIDDRHAEKALLPAVAELGVATLINRPFGEGKLFRATRGKSLPAWAGEYQIQTWSQFFLKFLISYPAVTCVIPATANPVHAKENIAAASALLPVEKTRHKMAEFIRSL